METYIPTDFPPGILGGQIHGRELDGVQALNRGLKDKEVRGRGRGHDRGLGRGGQGEDYRELCSFFAAGRRALNKVNCPMRKETDYALGINRCKYGDQCDFAHESRAPWQI